MYKKKLLGYSLWALLDNYLLVKIWSSNFWKKLFHYETNIYKILVIDTTDGMWEAAQQDNKK